MKRGRMPGGFPARGAAAVIAVTVALSMAGCATSEAGSPADLSAYVEHASRWIERCAQERGRWREAQAAAPGVKQCVEKGRLDVAPLLADAQHSTRWQRGTAMYLRLYAQRWSNVMECIANAPFDVDCQARANPDAADLRALAAGLSRP